jgi:diacylglycerol kinase
MVHKLKQSFTCSFNGLRMCFRGEKSFRLEIVVWIFAFPFSLVLCENMRHCILLNGTFLLVLCFELLNSAIEKTIDEAGQGQIREKFRYAKDCGSAAVLLGFVLCALVWLEAAWAFQTREKRVNSPDHVFSLIPGSGQSIPG